MIAAERSYWKRRRGIYDGIGDGASGFVGRHICAGLVKVGHPVRGLVRQVPVRKNRVDGVDYVRGVDVTEALTLTPEMFAGADAIIHLVGIIQENPRKGQTFQRVHVEGTRNVVDEALRAGFDGRLVYMSAIGSSMNSRRFTLRPSIRPSGLSSAPSCRTRFFGLRWSSARTASLSRR